MTLPFFPDANHTLRRESPECEGEFQESSDGQVTAGWRLRMPEPGPDGVPYLYIFVGPSEEHRGTAFRLVMAGKGGEVPAGARVLVESYYRTGSERTVIYDGTYGELLQAPQDVAAQRRAEAGQDYFVRVSVSVPQGAVEPDPWADSSWFELDCVKLWWNETA